MNHKYYFLLCLSVLLGFQSCQYKPHKQITSKYTLNEQTIVPKPTADIQTENDKFITDTNIGVDFDDALLEVDLKYAEFGLPLYDYTYPRKEYGGIAGAGVVDHDFEKHGLTFTGASFLVGNYDTFTNLFDNEVDSHKDFFTILCLTSKGNKGRTENKITSRNFPEYYLGQGKIKLKKMKIDYVAHIDPTGAAKAIVNEHIFDLSEKGKTIIIIPKPDGRLYFIQLKTPYVKLENVQNYYKETLFEQEELKKLLLQGQKIG